VDGENAEVYGTANNSINGLCNKKNFMVASLNDILMTIEVDNNNNIIVMLYEVCLLLVMRTFKPKKYWLACC
jgi:hypothetical protein